MLAIFGAAIWFFVVALSIVTWRDDSRIMIAAMTGVQYNNTVYETKTTVVTPANGTESNTENGTETETENNKSTEKTEGDSQI